MKTLALALIAALASAASTYSQAVPAPAAAKTEIAQAGPLTQEERDRAIEYLKQTQEEFAAALQDVSDAQWKFKAAPDRWSIAETAEHIAVTEDRIWDLVSNKMMKSPATPERRGEVLNKEEMIMKAIPDRSRKANAPEQLHPTGRWATKAELVKHFQEARAKEIAFLTETKEDLRSHFEEHPFLKTMDAWQWLVFNGAHGKRHTAQILEVKADPNYPKS
jgi:ribosomal protein S15P/S13E